MSGTWTSTTYTRQDGSIHLSCAETAKLIRKALKAAFPETKFSVRSDSYSMGASVYVSWTDGPTSTQVSEITDPYNGAGFDSMIDLKYHKEHWIEPDGTVTLAKREGTTGSVPELIQDPPTAESRLVSFGADYVLTSRSISPERDAQLRAEISAFLGEPIDNPSINYPAQAFKIDGGGMGLAIDTHSGSNWIGDLIRKLGNRDYSKPCSCPGGEAKYGCGGGKQRCSLCGEPIIGCINCMGNCTEFNLTGECRTREEG